MTNTTNMRMNGGSKLVIPKSIQRSPNKQLSARSLLLYETGNSSSSITEIKLDYLPDREKAETPTPEAGDSQKSDNDRIRMNSPSGHTQHFGGDSTHNTIKGRSVPITSDHSVVTKHSLSMNTITTTNPSIPIRSNLLDREAAQEGSMNKRLEVPDERMIDTESFPKKEHTDLQKDEKKILSMAQNDQHVYETENESCSHIMLNQKEKNTSNTSAPERKHDRTMTAESSGSSTADHSQKSYQSSSSSLQITAQIAPGGSTSSTSSTGLPHIKDGIGHYFNGRYLLRQDLFLHNSRGKLSSDDLQKEHDQNKAFFANIDSSFEDCAKEDYKNIQELDATEIMNISKICFAAMCIVFSSHNPSTTKISTDSESSESSVKSSLSTNSDDDALVKGSAMSSAYQSALERDTSKTAILAKHRRKMFADNFDLSGADSKARDKLLGKNIDGSQSHRSFDHASFGSSDELKNSTNKSNSVLLQRPSVPLPVVYMLWSKLILTFLEDKNMNDGKDVLVPNKLVTALLDRVEEVLVTKTSLLQMLPLKQKENSTSSTSTDEFFQDITFDIDKESACLKISHDLHLQYGLYISQNTKLFSFFFRGPSSEQGCQRLQFSYKIFDEDSWNPEQALNFVLASSCLSLIHNIQKPSSLHSMEKTQREYAFEMLPWHLMRSMQYQTVTRLLCDVSFVKGRLDDLDFAGATEMHVADFEELYDSVISLQSEFPLLVEDINVEKSMTECYGLLGSLIRSKDSYRWQYEDDHFEDADTPEDDVDLAYVKNVARSLQAVGDSLFRYKKEAESMKYYYRSLVRYEHVYSIESKSLKSSSSSSKRGLEKTQLQMGGVLSRIAAVYEHTNDKSDAMLCYEKALSFYSKGQSRNHLQGIAKTLASMGELHFSLKEYDSSLSCFNESLLMLRSMDQNSDEVAANLLIVMGNVRKDMGELNEALELFSEALYSKTVLYGKSHPEVAFIHQVIGIAYCEKPDFQKALSHFEDALKIRKDAVALLQEHLYANDKSGRIQARELEVSESLEAIARVYETLDDLDTSFIFFEESASIHHNHLLDLVCSESCVMMISDVFNSLQTDPDSECFLDDVYDHLKAIAEIGLRLCPLSRIFKTKLDMEDLIEIEGQVAEILLDMGTIQGAKFLLKMDQIDLEVENVSAIDVSSERKQAILHFEDSVTLRKRRIERLKYDESTTTEGEEEINYERITMAVMLYELGKMCSWLVLRNDIEDIESRNLRLIRPTSFAVRDCKKALAYFEEAREILRDSISISETLAYPNEEEDPLIARIHLTPSIYEEMLQMMAVLYRKVGQYEKSVQCYNEVAMLITRMGLDENHDKEDEVYISQKEKVAFSSQSIGDILFDTSEFSRALESYEEAIQMFDNLGVDSLIIADALNRKGHVLLKMKRWTDAVGVFNKALFIRVDRLPSDDSSIAESFHLISKCHEGQNQIEEALGYSKKAQKILSGHLVDTDIMAADAFFSLGRLVLLLEDSSRRCLGEAPNDDDIALALTNLALARDIYLRSFGEEALEVGDTLSLLGSIYHKYGEFSKAVSVFKKALAIFKTAPLDQSERIRESLVKLGAATADLPEADFDKVLECYGLAQDIYEEKEECKSVEYADLIFNIANAYLKQEEYTKAMEYFQDALALYNSILGNDHPIGSKILTKLGECLLHLRKHKEACSILENAQEIYYDSRKQQSELLLSDILFNLGIAHCETGRLNKAIDSYESSMKIRRKVLGENSIEYAQILNNIGSVFARNKEYQRALAPWQDAINIYISMGLNETDPKVACTKGNIEISTNLRSSTAREDKLKSINGY